jgi:Ankyrin repeats (3 copies)
VKTNSSLRFLLVKMHMDMLISQPTEGDIQEALRELGKGMEGLYRIYEEAMERIERQGLKPGGLAKRILAWIIHSKRPLLTEELQHALAVRPDIPGTRKLNTSFLPRVRVLLSLCAGLVTIDEVSGIIRLVHFTAQEFFVQRKAFPQADYDITKTYITYLSFEAFESGFCRTDDRFEERLQSHKLYDYASHNWGHHARQASVLIPEVIDFLKCKPKAEASSQAMMAYKMFSNSSQNVPRHITGLHLAAYFGVELAVNDLLDSLSKDLKDSYGRTPLSWAAENGHEATVKLLLEAKADIESKDSYYGRTPLSWAAENGHEAIVKLLLEIGKIDTNTVSHV